MNENPRRAVPTGILLQLIRIYQNLSDFWNDSHQT